MADDKTTISDMKRLVQEFVDERDWSQFHTPKNLSMSIAIEAAELMEHFQWLDTPDFPRIKEDAAAMEQIREELADVLCYAISFANAMGIDIDAALRDKMTKNAKKYPAEKFRGKFR
ncbi:MAG: nucleotide pyrophosphohydrolase [Planctomycetes bacterium]|nr:nucleotide pyrophosphohydrolase [Planctomycetota bacterium]